MNENIKEILKDNDELLVNYKDGSFECFDTLPQNVVDYITNLQESEAYYYGQYKDYKTRIEKAIEYVIYLGIKCKYRLNTGHLRKLKKILKGEC